jgi:polyribonucleotide nucleotidyltransferase
MNKSAYEDWRAAQGLGKRRRRAEERDYDDRPRRRRDEDDEDDRPRRRPRDDD